MTRWLPALCLLMAMAPAVATIDAYRFDDAEKAERFQRLSAELRCLVCQNQNLADSNAPLAQDLRREIYRMVQAGEQEQAIIDFMVTRYGDFVLYRPPVKPVTYLLWFGPFLLLVIAAATFVFLVRRRVSAVAEGALSPAERQRLATLLKAEDKEAP